MPETPSLDLAGWLEYVGGVHPKDWDLTLDRIGAVAATLGVNRAAPLVFLVAGTNGKGSTCTYIDALLRARGLRTGLTTSPHLRRFNERYRIDGREPSDAELVAAFEACERARGATTLTLFEYGALVALLLFRNAGLDACVLEIGLGGRYDAFNVAERDITVITRIALDHTEWLGSDRETIGAEKAGILVPGAPVVIADRDPPASVIAEAQTVGAPELVIGRDFDCNGEDARVAMDGETLVLSNLPSRQLPNPSFAAALQAVAAAGLLPEPCAIRDVARHVGMPGRFERRAGAIVDATTPAASAPPEIILDVAHNPDAAALLARRLAQEPGSPTIHAVFNCFEDKDLAGVLEPLAPLVSSWFLPRLVGPRIRDADALLQNMAELGVVERVRTCANAREALAAAQPGADLVLAFGSFPTVAAVGDVLG